MDTIRVNDNILNVAAIVYKDFNICSKVCKYRVVLNSEEIYGEIEIEQALMDNQQTVKEIYKRISGIIAEKLLNEVCRNNCGGVFP